MSIVDLSRHLWSGVDTSLHVQWDGVQSSAHRGGNSQVPVHERRVQEDGGVVAPAGGTAADVPGQGRLQTGCCVRQVHPPAQARVAGLWRVAAFRVL